jgi:hypothetical protein
VGDIEEDGSRIERRLGRCDERPMPAVDSMKSVDAKLVP